MDDSPLATLPAELRNEIWNRALQSDSSIQIATSSDSRVRRHDNEKTGRHILALTVTCKQVRFETLQLFYAINTFSLSTANRCLSRFCQDIGPVCAAALRQVQLSSDGAVSCCGLSRDLAMTDVVNDHVNQVLNMKILPSECYTSFAITIRVPDPDRETKISLDVRHIAAGLASKANQLKQRLQNMEEDGELDEDEIQCLIDGLESLRARLP